MKILIDTHTHTIASGHAYNTIDEMIGYAKEKGMEVLCITEHGPAMPGTCHEFYFSNMHILKKKKPPIRVLFGCEANIINETGELDLPAASCLKQDIIIASLHKATFESKNTKENNTCALIGACNNHEVTILGHIDDGTFPIDYRKVIEAAKATHTLIELNNSSQNPEGFRINARENALTILNLCKELEVPICIASDAHMKEEIGDFSYVEELLIETDFPENLIVNKDKETFLSYIAKKKGV